LLGFQQPLVFETNRVEGLVGRRSGASDSVVVAARFPSAAAVQVGRRSGGDRVYGWSYYDNGGGGTRRRRRRRRRRRNQ